MSIRINYNILKSYGSDLPVPMVLLEDPLSVLTNTERMENDQYPVMNNCNGDENIGK